VEIRIIDAGTQEHQEMLDLRYRVLRQPLGIGFSEEYLAREKDGIHIAAFGQGRLVGCCVLRAGTGTGIQLLQMAVDPGLQGRGVGKEVVLFAESVAREKGFTRVFMHARRYAEAFYEKLGYRAEGEEFEEVTIPHINMFKDL
jgi:N-acetylglutamate synthase-like GNAT family acetyltransferase